MEFSTNNHEGHIHGIPGDVSPLLTRTIDSHAPVGEALSQVGFANVLSPWVPIEDLQSENISGSILCPL